MQTEHCLPKHLLVTAKAGSLHLAVEVQGDVAELFLDVSDNLTLRRSSQAVTTLSHDLH